MEIKTFITLSLVLILGSGIVEGASVGRGDQPLRKLRASAEHAARPGGSGPNGGLGEQHEQLAARVLLQSSPALAQPPAATNASQLKPSAPPAYTLPVAYMGVRLAADTLQEAAALSAMQVVPSLQTRTAQIVINAPNSSIISHCGAAEPIRNALAPAVGLQRTAVAVQCTPLPQEPGTSAAASGPCSQRPPLVRLVYSLSVDTATDVRALQAYAVTTAAKLLSNNDPDFKGCPLSVQAASVFEDYQLAVQVPAPNATATPEAQQAALQPSFLGFAPASGLLPPSTPACECRCSGSRLATKWWILIVFLTLFLGLVVGAVGMLAVVYSVRAYEKQAAAESDTVLPPPPPTSLPTTAGSRSVPISPARPSGAGIGSGAAGFAAGPSYPTPGAGGAVDGGRSSGSKHGAAGAGGAGGDPSSQQQGQGMPQGTMTFNPMFAADLTMRCRAGDDSLGGAPASSGGDGPSGGGAAADYYHTPQGSVAYAGSSAGGAVPAAAVELTAAGAAAGAAAAAAAGGTAVAIAPGPPPPLTRASSGGGATSVSSHAVAGHVVEASAVAAGLSAKDRGKQSARPTLGGEESFVSAGSHPQAGDTDHEHEEDVEDGGLAAARGSAALAAAGASSAAGGTSEEGALPSRAWSLPSANPSVPADRQSVSEVESTFTVDTTTLGPMTLPKQQAGPGFYGPATLPAAVVAGSGGGVAPGSGGGAAGSGGGASAGAGSAEEGAAGRASLSQSQASHTHSQFSGLERPASSCNSPLGDGVRESMFPSTGGAASGGGAGAGGSSHGSRSPTKGSGGGSPEDKEKGGKPGPESGGPSTLPSDKPPAKPRASGPLAAILSLAAPFTSSSSTPVAPPPPASAPAAITPSAASAGAATAAVSAGAAAGAAALVVPVSAAAAAGEAVTAVVSPPAGSSEGKAAAGSAVPAPTTAASAAAVPSASVAAPVAAPPASRVPAAARASAPSSSAAAAAAATQSPAAGGAGASGGRAGPAAASAAPAPPAAAQRSASGRGPKDAGSASASSGTGYAAAAAAKQAKGAAAQGRSAPSSKPATTATPAAASARASAAVAASAARTGAASGSSSAAAAGGGKGAGTSRTGPAGSAAPSAASTASAAAGHITAATTPAVVSAAEESGGAAAAGGQAPAQAGPAAAAGPLSPGAAGPQPGLQRLTSFALAHVASSEAGTESSKAASVASGASGSQGQARASPSPSPSGLATPERLSQPGAGSPAAGAAAAGGARSVIPASGVVVAASVASEPQGAPGAPLARATSLTSSSTATASAASAAGTAAATAATAVTAMVAPAGLQEQQPEGEQEGRDVREAFGAERLSSFAVRVPSETGSMVSAVSHYSGTSGFPEGGAAGTASTLGGAAGASTSGTAQAPRGGAPRSASASGTLAVTGAVTGGSGVRSYEVDAASLASASHSVAHSAGSISSAAGMAAALGAGAGAGGAPGALPPVAFAAGARPISASTSATNLARMPSATSSQGGPGGRPPLPPGISTTAASSSSGTSSRPATPTPQPTIEDAAAHAAEAGLQGAADAQRQAALERLTSFAVNVPSEGSATGSVVSTRRSSFASGYSQPAPGSMNAALQGMGSYAGPGSTTGVVMAAGEGVPLSPVGEDPRAEFGATQLTSFPIRVPSNSSMASAASTYTSGPHAHALQLPPGPSGASPRGSTVGYASSVVTTATVGTAGTAGTASTALGLPMPPILQRISAGSLAVSQATGTSFSSASSIDSEGLRAAVQATLVGEQMGLIASAGQPVDPAGDPVLSYRAAGDLAATPQPLPGTGWVPTATGAAPRPGAAAASGSSSQVQQQAGPSTALSKQLAAGQGE